MTPLVVDTSVAVPLLLAKHDAHAAVVAWWGGRPVALSGHALAETYSVLTRLPAGLRAEPSVAAALIEERFDSPVLLRASTARRLARTLARQDIGGGAVYDALVGLAAKEHGAVLATRDARARPTYEAVGARVEIVR